MNNRRGSVFTEQEELSCRVIAVWVALPRRTRGLLVASTPVNTVTGTCGEEKPRTSAPASDASALRRTT